MKKFIFIIIGILAISCNKIDIENKETFSNVSFNVNVLEGVSFTKSLDNNEIVSAIRETFPTYYRLRLKNIENGNVYEMRSDETKHIPNGKYEVTNFNQNNEENVGVGSLAGVDCNPEHSITVNGGWGICKYPKIVIKDTITISNDGKINLNGNFKCQAFVYDNTIIENVKFHIYVTDKYDVKCVNVKNNVSFFFSWDTDSCEYGIGLTCFPKENVNAETTKYYVNIAQNYGGLTYGKYYILKCNEVGNSEVENDVNVNSFSAGEDLSSYMQ